MPDAQEIKDKVRAGDYQGVKSAVADAADQVRHNADAVRSSVADAADQARQKAEEFSRGAKERMEQSRSSAADAMDSTAERVRQSSYSAASNVAGGLHSAADYVRHNSFGNMFSDLGTVIRKNPAPSLIAAVALGFLLGSALRRGD